MLCETFIKFREPQAVKGAATRQLFETYTKYFGVGDKDQKKGLRRFLW